MRPPKAHERVDSWVVYYQARTARGAPKPWYWANTGEMTEAEARAFYQRMVDRPHENIRRPRLVQRMEMLVRESDSGGK